MSGLAPSRYNVFVPLRHARTLAYNSLSGALALWDDADQAAFARVAGGLPVPPTDPTILQLLQGGFAVAGGVDELGLLEQQYRAQRFDPSTMILTIAPTLACNFGCDYCYQGQDKPRDAMSDEVQDAVVAMVERALPRIKRLQIAWYGGEPLIKRRIVEALSDRLIAACAAANVGYSAMMVTNGYLLDGEVARSLHDRRVNSMQVTLDGSPNYHDRRRSLLSGKPTFARIVDNLKSAVDAAPIHQSIRVNIDERNREEIHGLIDFLAAEGLGHRKNFSIYFAPVEAMTEGCHSVQDVTLSKLDYGSLESELTRHAWEKGLAPLPYPPRFRGICGAVRPKGYVITPTGDLHKCWDTVSQPERAVGTVFALDRLGDNEQIKAWMGWTPFANESCRNCRILPNCAGSCAFKFVHASDTRGEQATLPCPSWKYNLKERLVLRAIGMGAITADDYDVLAIRTDPRELCTEDHLGGDALPAAIQAAKQASFSQVAARAADDLAAK